MKKLILSCVMLMLVGPWAALADGPVDPDPNILGLYFDTEGIHMEAWADPFQPVEMHLVLTRPTFEAVVGLEFSLTVEGPFIGCVSAMNNGGTCPPAELENFVYGCASPLTLSEATWLVRIEGYLTSTTPELVTFRLHGTSPSSLPGDLPVVGLPGGILQQLNTPVAPGEICAQINGEEPIIATENAEWGMVKTLYR